MLEDIRKLTLANTLPIYESVSVIYIGFAFFEFANSNDIIVFYYIFAVDWWKFKFYCSARLRETVIET